MIALVLGAWAADVEVRLLERGTGDPLVGTVTLGSTTVPTDDKGRIVLDLTAPTTLSVVAPGYEATELSITPPQNRPVRVFLREGRAPLEIVVEAFRPTPDTSRHVVDAEMIWKTPGNREDAVRLVQSLPGVAVQREYSPSAGSLSVRGSAPHDSRYYLDGIEVPYLYHFNQYASVFPASQLGKLELFSSTFGARYGDSVGAIVEAESARDRPEALHGSAYVNFVIMGAQFKAPVSKKWWVAASARRSYQDLVGEQTDQFTVWPVFNDFALRAEHGNARRGTGVFFWGAGDSYARAAGELDLLDPVEAQVSPLFTYSRNFQVAGVRHHWATPMDWGQAVVAVVHDRLDGELTGNGRQLQDTLSLSSRFDASHRFTSYLGWDMGYELRTESLALTVSEPGNARVLVAQEVPALARGVEIDAKQRRTQGGLYGTAFLGWTGVRLMPSLRLGFDSATSEAQVQPRMTARIRLSDSTEIRAGGGRYDQRPPSTHLFDGTGDPNLPTTHSWQLAAGLEQTIAGRLTLNVEVYRKWLTDVLVFPIDSPATVAATGDATGIEITWRYHIRETFFMHGWGAYARSFVGEGDERLPSDGDQPVSFGAVVSWDVSKRLNLGIRYRLGSGLPFTPLDGSVYDAGEDGWIPTPGGRNSERMPLYQKVDMRAQYTIPFRRWELSFNTELWYVPKASAQLYPAYNYDYRERNWVRGPTLFPLAGLRAEF